MINKGSLFKTAIILFSYLFLMSQAFYDSLPQQKNDLIKLLETKFNITDRNIITALQSVNREDFLPEELKKYAYIDISVPIDNSNVIISYSDLMKAITSLKNTRREKALVIGKNSDFTAVILSFLYKQVYLIESNIELKDRNETLIKGRYNNIISAFSNDHNYFSINSPFDLVFINSSINEFTSNYIDLVNQNGEVIFALSDRYGFNILHKATKIGFSYNITILGEVLFPSLN
ncbi:MAG: hypothetical protein FWF38_05580 [Spirochaetaceae bacterium]|nr:hypothetical protein [Spirochaetaceae bacterium]